MATKKRLHQTFDEVQEILDRVDVKATIKSGTTEYWAGQDYVPAKDELIIYTDKSSREIDGETVYVPGVKIGSGNAYVSDLAFVGDDVADTLLEHINDNVRHITPAERAAWNNKLNVDDNFEVEGTTLVLNRN